MKPPLTVLHCGKLAGQSVPVLHCVQLPIAHTLAVEAPGAAAGQSWLVLQGMPVPIGLCGMGGQEHWPHHWAAPQPGGGAA
jgi:hypothetical protein